MTAIQDALIETLRRYSVAILTQKKETQEYKSAKNNFFYVYQLMKEWHLEIPHDLKDYYTEWYLGGN